jgi:hypothetical protein
VKLYKFSLKELFSSRYSKLPTAQNGLEEKVNDWYVDKCNADAWDWKPLPML